MTLRRPRVLREAWRMRAKSGDEALAWALALATEAERRTARSRQESEGMRRRASRERRDGRAEGRKEAVLPVLEALDAMDSAMAADSPPAGLEAVRDLVLRRLAEAGLEEVAGVGETVDPAVHEVVSGAGSEVARVLRRGFLADGRLVRAAMVEARG